MPSPLFNPANITCQGNGTQRSLDVMSELFNHRVLMLNSEVTTATCSQLIADLLVLEYKDPHAPVTLLISSPGGEVHAGLGLIDVMDDIACPVNTVAFRLVAPVWQASSWHAERGVAPTPTARSCCINSSTARRRAAKRHRHPCRPNVRDARTAR